MRTIGLFLGVLLSAVALAGCAARQPVYDGQVADHSIDDFDQAPKAVYANQVPVYPRAELTDAMGSESWGDEPDSYSKGMGWEFEFKGEKADVVTFYDAALPNAAREVAEDGEVIWTLVPEGALPGEEVMVRVGEKEFWIHEDVKPRPKQNS
jgi:hypothetical protein